MKKKKLGNAFEKDMEKCFWIVMSVFVAFFILLKAYPIIWGVIMSFTNFTGFNLDSLKFTGLANYKHVFTDRMALPAILVPLKIGVVTIPAGMVVGLFLSILLSNEYRGCGIFRTLIYLPSLIPGIAMAIMWRGMFSYNGGLFNTLLTAFGGKSVNWFSDPYIRRGVMLMCIYSSCGGILSNIAIIKGIPEEMYEAAKMEGANAFQNAWYITLPMMSNMLYMGLLTSLIYTLQMFEQPVFLAGGTGGTNALTTVPPDSAYTYVVHIYQQIFVNMRFGYGLALIWVIFIVIMALSLFMEWSKRFWVYKETD